MRTQSVEPRPLTLCRRWEPCQCLHWVIVALIALWTVSCGSTTREGKHKPARFRDGAAANCVIRFYSWDAIHMVRPDTRENGFLPMLNREGVAHELDRRGSRHELAVVVLGYMLSNAQEAELIREWNEFFAARGFHRVVLLRAGNKNHIDGLIIVRDSAIAVAYEAPAAAAFSAVPSTAGADAAHSSIGSIR